MRHNPWKAVSLVLAAALAASLLAPIRSADAAPSNLESALERLESALTFLQKSTQDRGGHRAKAIAHTKQAIDEVKLGIAAARKGGPPPVPPPTAPAPAPLNPKPPS